MFISIFEVKDGQRVKIKNAQFAERYRGYSALNNLKAEYSENPKIGEITVASYDYHETAFFTFEIKNFYKKNNILYVEYIGMAY